MGSVYRRFICTECRTKYMNSPQQCKCGNDSFRPTSWIVAWYVNGQRHEKSWKGVTKAEANRILRKLEGEAVIGDLGLKKEKRITLGEYIEQTYWPFYMAGKRSSGNVRYELDRYIIPEFGSKSMGQITTVDIAKWRNRLLEKLKPSSTNRLIDRLSGIYTKANKWGHIKYHPVRELERLEENGARENILTPEQYARMIDMIDEMPFQEAVRVNLKAAITLAIATTLRKDNLFSLQWDKHVNMKERLISVPGTESKNKEPIRLPMFDIVHDTLSGLPRPLHSKFVLTSKLHGKYQRYMQNHWKALRDRLAEEDDTFKEFRWHDLRATGASWYIMAGVPERTVMRIMNLKSTHVLSRYDRQTLEHIKREGDKARENFRTNTTTRGETLEAK